MAMRNKKNIVRIIFSILAITLLASVFTGCTFVGPHKEKDKYKNKGSSDYDYLREYCSCTDGKHNGNDNIGNILCVVWNNNISTFNGRDQVEMDWVHTTEANATHCYGADTTGGMNFFKQIAVLMYTSIFDKDYYGVGAKDIPAGATVDHFIKDKDLFDQFSLAPLDLIHKVNKVTTAAILGQTQGSTRTETVTKPAIKPVGPSFDNKDDVIIDDYIESTETIEVYQAPNLQPIFTLIKSAAAAILISVWAMGFISQVVNERFSMDTLLKTLMQLLCGIIIVINADKIVIAFFNVGDGMVSKLAETMAANSGFDKFEAEMLKLIQSMEVWCIGISFDGLINVGIGTLFWQFDCVFAILLMALPFVAQIICAYKIVSMMIMRMLELIIRITFAAIPLAFSAQSGFGPETIRYFRSIMACAMQPLLMMVAALMVGTISTATLQIFNMNAAEIGGIGASLALTLSYLILSAFLGETKHLSQEIIAR